ncbi:MAG: hypothetical protein LBC61_01915 [Candidatus Peribacteria bacterium]|nr:hypothetical protein [Candidatus Peribacteria bacterium]
MKLSIKSTALNGELAFTKTISSSQNLFIITSHFDKTLSINPICSTLTHSIFS